MRKYPSLLNRLIISDEDLWQAKEFAEYILDKNLHGKRDREGRLILLAFNTSLIISYSRPFLDSRGRINTTEKRLPGKFLKVLTRQERALHDLIIKSRQTEYAHSDADSHSIRMSSHKGIHIPTGRNPFVPLTRTQVKQSVTIIQKLWGEVFKERFRLEQQLDRVDSPDDEPDANAHD